MTIDIEILLPLLSSELSSDVSELSQSLQTQLETNLLTVSWQVAAFDLTAATVGSVVERRIARFHQIYPDLNRFCQQLGWQSCPVDLLWLLWLPLAEQILAWRAAASVDSVDSVNPVDSVAPVAPLMVGISGIQGTGKTTLTLILAEILRLSGLHVCIFSIDDLYNTYAERQQLQQVDPRLKWRGPPGTHDLALGMNLLQQLRQADFPVALPRFDKSLHHGAGDRTEFETVTHADVVLFEGWFVGTRPIDASQFADPCVTMPPPICTEADRQFARDMNSALSAYLPLWEQLDRLIVLYPVDYQFSQQWRQQAEHRMIASGKSGMSASEITEFVSYFWRALHPELFMRPLLQDAERVDLVIEIDADHQPLAIYQPT